MSFTCVRLNNCGREALGVARIIGRNLLLLTTLCVLGCSSSADLDESERAVLLTEADFKAFGPPIQAGLTGKFSKETNYFEGNVVLSYTFEGSDFSLANSVTIERSTAHAMITRTAQRAGIIIAWTSGGVVEESVKLGSSYGENASLSVLKRSGKPIGNVFTTIIGRKVYLLVFSGIYFEDPNDFGPLIAQKMDALTKYNVR